MRHYLEFTVNRWGLQQPFSMLVHLKIEADFHIVDCPFSDFTEQVLHIMRKETPLRSAMVLRIANLFLKMRDGYSLKLVSPREVVSQYYKTGAFHP